MTMPANLVGVPLTNGNTILPSLAHPHHHCNACKYGGIFDQHGEGTYFHNSVLNCFLALYSGFDPIGFTNAFDVKFLREAEIKHCRVAMLAALVSITFLYF